jgi:hypothetical protein
LSPLSLVPTVPVGMPSRTLCVPSVRRPQSAPRRRRGASKTAFPRGPWERVGASRSGREPQAVTAGGSPPAPSRHGRGRFPRTKPIVAPQLGRKNVSNAFQINVCALGERQRSAPRVGEPSREFVPIRHESGARHQINSRRAKPRRETRTKAAGTTLGDRARRTGVLPEQSQSRRHPADVRLRRISSNIKAYAEKGSRPPDAGVGERSRQPATLWLGRRPRTRPDQGRTTA